MNQTKKPFTTNIGGTTVTCSGFNPSLYDQRQKLHGTIVDQNGRREKNSPEIQISAETGDIMVWGSAGTPGILDPDDSLMVAAAIGQINAIA